MTRPKYNKRKLEHEQDLSEVVTPKRFKSHSTVDSARKHGPTTNGNSPIVLVSRRDNLKLGDVQLSASTSTLDGSGSTAMRESKEGKAQSTPVQHAALQKSSQTNKGAQSGASVMKASKGPDTKDHGRSGQLPRQLKTRRSHRRSQSAGPDDYDAVRAQLAWQLEADFPQKEGSKVRSPKKEKGLKEPSELALTKIRDINAMGNPIVYPELSVDDRSKDNKGLLGKKKKKRVEKAAERADVAARDMKHLLEPNQHGWRLSQPTGGRYIDHDALFVQDGNGDPCLIAATSSEIQLLSLDNSLVVRSHIVPEGTNIVCFSRSTGSSPCIDVAYNTGAKVQWNWVTSAISKGTFPGQENVVAMASEKVADSPIEMFYISRNKDVHTIVGERKSMYSTANRLKSIQVLRNGAYIVCYGPKVVVLGSRKELAAHSEYIWTELPFSVPIRCADARLNHRQRQRSQLSLAVGNAEGKILLYTDLSTVFSAPSKSTLAPPQVLHWHRESVSTIKFSKDGNYLISGGKETVLVLWQLETGKREYLPHLTAEIERIIVGPEGTMYALQMGDNSIMVLSTSELKPIANFAGLQLPLQNEELVAQGVSLPATHAILHPHDPDQLLLSVPASQPKLKRDVTTRPFIQSFDTRNSRHLARQALTRNNVTDLSQGPEKLPIIPPDVSHFAVSADGCWLATVDEWIVPATDLAHTLSRTTGLSAEDLQDLEDEQIMRREVNLKFWRWSQKDGLWTLSTKAEAPHARSVGADPGCGAGTVLKLTTDPLSNCFATVGEDNNVKVWKPRTRTRHGIPIQEPDGLDAVDWVCHRAIPLPFAAEAAARADSPMEHTEEHESSQVLNEARLAFSEDGSLLACGQVYAESSTLQMVHLISPSTGAVLASKTGLSAPEQDLIEIGFLDHYIISLSTKAVRVWNLVDDSHLYTAIINGSPDDETEPMLAINPADKTFAIAHRKLNGLYDVDTTKVAVYSAKSPECLFEAELVVPPAALLSGKEMNGFMILFEDATIRTLSTSGTASARDEALPVSKNAPLALPSAETVSALAVAQVDTEDSEMANATSALALSAGEYTTEATEDDRAVVRPEQVASIFDVGQSYAMPPVKDMFQAIVGLYGRKPRHLVEGDGIEVEMMG